MKKSILAFISFVVAVILTFVSLFIPPPGEIDGSVLLVVAQFLILTTTLLGVDGYINVLNNKK